MTEACIIHVEPRPRLAEREAIGLELSVPLGNLAIKAELTREKEVQDLNNAEFSVLAGPGSIRPFQQPLVELRNWIIDRNSGRLWLERDFTIFGVGVDWNSDLWLVNATILSAMPSYSGNNKTGSDLALRADVLDNPEVSSQTFPTFNVLRRFGQDLKQSFGVAVGLVGFAAGLTAYWTDDTRENLQYGASLDLFQYLGDNQYENEGSQDPEEDSTIDDAIIPSLRFFVRYQF